MIASLRLVGTLVMFAMVAGPTACHRSTSPTSTGPSTGPSTYQPPSQHTAFVWTLKMRCKDDWDGGAWSFEYQGCNHRCLKKNELLVSLVDGGGDCPAPPPLSPEIERLWMLGYQCERDQDGGVYQWIHDGCLNTCRGGSTFIEEVDGGKCMLLRLGTGESSVMAYRDGGP